MSDIEQRLREAMDGVTPGPWVAEMGGKGGWVKGSTGEWCAMSCGDTNYSANANAAYITLCSPDNIGALLDTITSLRSKLEEAEGALEPFAEAGKAMLLTGGKNPKLSGHRLAEHLECARRTLASLREADHA